MAKRRLFRLLLAVSALTVACSDEDGTGPDAGEARLRVVHAEPQTSEIDASVDEIEMVSDLTYLSASDYLEVEAGRRRLTFVTETGTLDDFDANLAEGTDYTVLPCCSDFPGGSLLLADDNSESPEGDARLRVVHFATAPLLDVYLTAPDEDLEGTTPRLAGVGAFEASEYIEVSADDYQIRLTPAGSKTVLIDGGIVALSPGQVRTAIAVDAPGGGEPFSLLVLEDVN